MKMSSFFSLLVLVSRIFACNIFRYIDFLVGRAGRYKSKFPTGEVTCLDRNDLPLLHSSLNSPSPILEVRIVFLFRMISLHSRLSMTISRAVMQQAGLFPSFDLIHMFSQLHPTYGLQHILVGPFSRLFWFGKFDLC